MTHSPTSEGLPPDLRFLKILVTTLTATMILGLVTVIWLLVIRLPEVRHELATPPLLPEAIALPDGATLRAVTQAPGWFALVTTNDAILIYDSATGQLIQTVQILSQP